MSDVWWSILSERAGSANDQCWVTHLQVASECGKQGYKSMLLGYSRTDFARNELTKKFLEISKRDDDLLVMLDGDHKYIPDIVSRFAAEDPKMGVVGALAYRRGEPYDPLFFIRDLTGTLRAPAQFERGELFRCAIVSTSAISIRRWVLVELNRAGYLWPWFRYEYPTNQSLPSEDMYFGRICEQAGIWHHCDSAIEIPHSSVSFVDHDVNEAYLKSHPELIGETMVAG